MKILQLCNKIPYPSLDGGAIATLNMALSLAEEGHEVHILAMNTQKHHYKTENIPNEIRSKLHFTYVDIKTDIRVSALLFNLLFSRLPYNAVRFHSKIFSEKLEETLKNGKYDLVQLEGLYLCSYVPLVRNLHKGKIVYRAHNIESDIWAGRVVTEKNFFHKTYLSLLTRRMIRYEKSFINHYDILLPITHDDNDKLTAMGNRKPSHVTFMGVLESALSDNIPKKAPDSLFFIGALDWAPNPEGISWFLEKVWPRLAEKHPQLQLHIAGRNAPEWFAKMCRTEQVSFHGEIEDAHLFMDDHGIMIVPLFAGSGLRIKIVEAMARSRVIITTSTGAKGLPGLKGDELLVTDDASEWVRRISAMLNDPSQYSQRCKAAFAYAKENFTNKAIITKLLYFYSEEGIC